MMQNGSNNTKSRQDIKKLVEGIRLSHWSAHSVPDMFSGGYAVWVATFQNGENKNRKVNKHHHPFFTEKSSDPPRLIIQEYI